MSECKCAEISNCKNNISALNNCYKNYKHIILRKIQEQDDLIEKRVNLYRHTFVSDNMNVIIEEERKVLDSQTQICKEIFDKISSRKKDLESYLKALTKEDTEFHEEEKRIQREEEKQRNNTTYRYKTVK